VCTQQGDWLCIGRCGECFVCFTKVNEMFKKMEKSTMCQELIAVSTELLSLLQSCQNNVPEPWKQEMSFVSLLANDDAQVYALQTLAHWAPKYCSVSYLIESRMSFLEVCYESGVKRSHSSSPLCDWKECLQMNVWGYFCDWEIDCLRLNKFTNWHWLLLLYYKCSDLLVDKGAPIASTQACRMLKIRVY
jgi:hypothetical protein